MEKRKKSGVAVLLNDIRDRLIRMETEMAKIGTITRANKERLSRVETTISREVPTTKEPKSSDIFLGVDRTSTNPWVTTALQELTQIDTSKFINQTRETLRSTIKVLLESKGGLDAEKVGEKTGRKRNTESYYLNRLCRMGLAKKTKTGRNVIYKITKEEKRRILDVFPEFKNE